MMKQSGKALLAIVVLASAMTVGCSQVMNDYSGSGRTGWKIAHTQDNVPTKIRYSFRYEIDGSGTPSHWLHLYNGYDTPVKISYKIYFTSQVPQFYDQYIFTKKEAVIPFSASEPAKVEIVRIIEQ